MLSIAMRSFGKAAKGKKGAKKSTELGMFADYWFGDTIGVWDRHSLPPNDERLAIWFNATQPNPLWVKQVKDYYEKDLE